MGAGAAAVLRRRIGLDGPAETLERIGSDLGLTRERIRQIEVKAARVLQARWPEGRPTLDSVYTHFRSSPGCGGQLELMRAALDACFALEVARGGLRAEVLAAWDRAGKAKRTPMTAADVRSWAAREFSDQPADAIRRWLEEEGLRHADPDGQPLFFSTDPLDALLRHLRTRSEPVPLGDLADFLGVDDRSLRGRLSRDRRFIEDEANRVSPAEAYSFDRRDGRWFIRLDPLPNATVGRRADAHHVYVGSENPNALVVLRRHDLTEIRRVETGHPVGSITPLNDRYVALNGRVVLSVSDFKPVPPEGHPAVRWSGFDRHSGGLPPLWTGDGWWCRGVLYDPTFEKLRAIIAPQGFLSWPTGQPSEQSLGLDDAPTGYGPDGAVGRWYSPWGAWWTAEGRLVAGGRTFEPTPHDAAAVPVGPVAAAVLPDRPVAALLSVSRQRSPNGEDLVAEVRFFSLAAAKPVAEVVLKRSPYAPANGVDTHEPWTEIAARRDGELVCLVERHLYFVAPPAAPSESCPVPLRLLPDYPVRVVRGTEDVSLPVPEVVGGAGARLSLAREPEGMRYDAAARRVALAPAALIKRLTGETGDRGRGSEGFLNEYRERAIPAFEQLTGSKPVGVPVWVPFEVVAEGNGGRFVGRYGFFLDLPLRDVFDRADAARRAQARGHAAAVPGPVGEAVRASDALSRRIDALEQKVEALSRKVDALTEAISDAAAKPEK